MNTSRWNTLEVLGLSALLTLVAWGCGGAPGDDGSLDDAGLAADSGSSTDTIPIPENPPPETPGVDAEREVLLAAWGTAGSDRTEGVSAQDHALCDLDDVEMNDLDGLSDFELAIPAFPYPSSVVHDEQARCGVDADTLLWRLMNCERISRGLTPYQCDLRVLWVARRHTADQIEGDFLAHEGSDGSDLAERANDANLSWQMLGENVGWAGSLLEMHHGWMDSAGHRTNILDTMLTHAAGSAGARTSGWGLRGTQVFVRFL
jgi:hypothetical protein